VRELDEALFLWINGWVGKFTPMDEVMKLIASDYLVPVTLALILFALWFAGTDLGTRERYQIGIVVAVFAVALANSSIEVLNNFYFRDRPFLNHEAELLFYRPTDSSFPANSAAAAFAIAGSVGIFQRRLAIVIASLAALYAFSRVYVGVHYPLDVVGGAVFGLVAVPIAVVLVRIIRPALLLSLRWLRLILVA
jgi:undecaprenyl-diphosphatase|tara:strand:- start:1787 stop:2368 length:582 start_codon:yes stop_codon:yes gene_type:complete